MTGNRIDHEDPNVDGASASDASGGGTKRFSRQMWRLLEEVFGPEQLAEALRRGVRGEDEDALDLLGDESIGSILGADTTKVAIVGVSNVGKSSLINALFKRQVVLEGARTDITNQIARVRLPSGVLLYDTPGLGGLDEDSEEVTRAYLELPPYRTQLQVVPFCFLDAGQECSHCEANGPFGARDVTLPAVKECTDTIHCANARRLRLGTPEFREEQPDVVIQVFSLVAGLKRDDRVAYDLLKEHLRCPLIPVANFVSSLRTPEDRAQAEVGAKKVAPDVVCLDSKSHEGIKPLVDRIFAALPTAKYQEFSRELHERFRVSRDEVFANYVGQIAAKAALADTRQKTSRLLVDPENPNNTAGKKVKLTQVDLLSEALGLRIVLDYSFDEKSWREGTNIERIGELIASRRDTVTALLGGGITAGSLVLALSVASATVGNLGFYAVAATVLGWFGLGGPAWMAGIAALGGPVVVVPVLAILLGAATFGLLRWIRPGWIGGRFGGYNAVEQIYRQAFLLRRQLCAAIDEPEQFQGDEKRTKALMKELRKSVEDEVEQKLAPHRKFIKSKVAQFEEDPKDTNVRNVIEKRLAEVLKGIIPDPSGGTSFFIA